MPKKQTQTEKFWSDNDYAQAVELVEKAINMVARQTLEEGGFTQEATEQANRLVAAFNKVRNG